MSVDQVRPQCVVAGRPQPSRATLRQRRGSRQRAGLALEHVEIMLKLEDRRKPHIRSLMASETLAGGPQLDVGRPELRFDAGPDCGGHRVRIGLHAHAPRPVDLREAHFLQVEPLRRQRPQGRVLDRHRLANGLGPPVDHARLVGATPGQQLRIQRVEVRRLGQRHPVIPPEIARLAFHAALLVAFTRRAKLRVELPMGAKRQKPRGLLASESPQDFADRTGEIVVPQRREHAPEVVERALVRFEKRLLRRPRISAMERRTTRHAPHAEHLQRHGLVAEDRHRFVPIDLGLLAPAVRLRDADHLAAQALRALPAPHILAHRRRGDRRLRPLATQPIVDAARRVPLLARRQAIALQNPIDELLHRCQRGPRPRQVSARRRHRIGQRLAHDPPMHTQLAGHAFNRPDAELILPSNLCEQLHAGSPVQPTLLDPAGIDTGQSA